MNLVDTSGWIEYFFAGPNSAYFALPIETTDDLIVPTICLYEIFKKVTAAGGNAPALQAVALMKQGRVVDITEDVALSAALISLDCKLPMADSLIYATARSHKAVLWSQDEHFRNLPGVNFKKAAKKSGGGNK